MIQQIKTSWLRSRSSLSSKVSWPAWKMDKVGASFGLITALLVFSVLSAPFRRLDNLMLIADEASLIGIVAAGQTLVLLIGGIDLSVGSVVAFSGVIAASLMKGFGPVPALPSYLAIIGGLILGTLVGALQGWLITHRNMPPFIVTLGTMIGLRGLTQSYANAADSPVHSLPDDFKWISDGQLGPIPAPALIMIGIYALTWYLLHNTKFGRYCYAIGGNETTARLTGVNINRYKVLVYAISGLLAAVAGIILIAQIDGGIYTNGSGYELNSIAAAIIGGTSLSGGVGGVWGTLVGVLLLNTVNNGLTLCSVSPEWQEVVTGAVILLAVLIDVERRRRPKTATSNKIEHIAPVQLHLHQILIRLAQAVESQLGHLYCCLYLADRDTGDLVPQTPFITGKSDENSENLQAPTNSSYFISEVKHTREAVWVEDIGRNPKYQIVALHPGMQSALAVPLTVRNRVVGVLEVQSFVPNCFGNEAATLLHNLTNSMTEVLEDAWLMESGWLVRQVRDNLRHLWDDLYLGRSELAEWVLTVSDTNSKQTTLGTRGAALREVLQAGIESLRPAESRNPSRSGRSHSILQLTYIEERTVDNITKDLNISRRQYFYDLKEALDILSDTLVRNHQIKLQTVSSKEVQKLLNGANIL